LAQLGTTTPHRIDGLPRYQRTARFGGMVLRRGIRHRNPIFTAMMVFGFGIALVTPNLVAVAGFLLPVTTIELQVRIVEEPYLLTVHGDAYRD
jgi:protein-S-isoprenylcysteine O-methyltransferase Ste14